LLLSFSGAFLLSLTLFELLPEAYESENPKVIGAFIALGILLQLVLEYFSKGAEHGHVHLSSGNKFPWLLLASLCIHAFIEGIPLSQNTHFIWGIVVHKIPVALILGTFLLNSGLSFNACWGFILLFALMTPMGALLGGNSEISDLYPYLLALVIGVVLHVATVILFESSEGHSLPWRKLAVIIGGMVLGYML
jgi:zinc transporter ZupT